MAASTAFSKKIGIVARVRGMLNEQVDFYAPEPVRCMHTNTELLCQTQVIAHEVPTAAACSCGCK